MSLRSLRFFALFIVASSISAHAQSLGDVARQLRAEHQQEPGSHPRVITNDDIASPEQDVAPPTEAASTDAKDEGDATTPATDKGKEAAPTTGAKNAKSNNKSSAKSNDKTHSDPAKEREARELEIQARTKEINKTFLDRIAAIHEKITAAQSEAAKLQRDRIESTTAYQQSVGANPNLGTYEQQQRTLIEQIEGQRDLIQTLNSQLADAEESARHAGVPHASD